MTNNTKTSPTGRTLAKSAPNLQYMRNSTPESRLVIEAFTKPRPVPHKANL